VGRGALDARASTITREMELAAAHALAAVVESDHLEADYVIPGVFDRRVAPLWQTPSREPRRPSGVARKTVIEPVS
jgi:malate dehydrogenase (oxaloacetate-decarboxylating)